jgi:hypothetical protein
MVLASISALAAAPTDLLDQWHAEADVVAAKSPVPVPLGPDDVAELLAGRSVARRFDTPSGAYATGAVWVPAPIDAVWVVLQDAPHDPPSKVSVQRLQSPPGMRRVYMKLDLPFPLSDRQWVADVVTNGSLYDASGGDVWQRQWTLGDPGLAPSPDPDGVWVQESRGAWTLLAVGDGTLVLFSVRSVLGGALPESITQAFAIGQIRTALDRVSRRAQEIPAHYVAGHERITDPGGTAIAYR